MTKAFTSASFCQIATPSPGPGSNGTDALKRAGCTRIFEEKASGTRADRPELARALAIVRDGDVLIVWKLDRLGRSLGHLIATVRNLVRSRGSGFAR